MNDVKKNFDEFGKLIGSDSPGIIADAFEKMTAPDPDCCRTCRNYVGYCGCPYHLEGEPVTVMNTITNQFRDVKDGFTSEVDWCINHERRK
jgi:hypothetical protein